MTNPLVSIIIPTYNRGELIQDTINSVREQSFCDWECIVVDDGSTDSTDQILKQICNMDSRFIYIKRPASYRKGAAVCRNIGLDQSKGKYIQFLDSDDLISSDKLKCQLKKIESGEDVSLVTCKWGRFENDLNDAEVYNRLPSYKSFDNPLNFFESLPPSLNFFPIHAYLIKKTLIIKTGYWNEFIKFNDDAEFICRVISNSSIIEFCEEAVAFYRKPNSNNVSAYDGIEKIQNGIDSWKLIEDYMRIRFGNSKNSYVFKGKTEFYNHIKDFPEIIKRNKIFFKEQIINEKTSKSFLTRYFK